MTGVKKEEDVIESLNLIIDKLKKTKGTIPLNKILVKKQLELLLKELDTDIIPKEYFNDGDSIDKLYRIKEFFDIFCDSKIELILDTNKIYYKLFRLYDKGPELPLIEQLKNIIKKIRYNNITQRIF